MKNNILTIMKKELLRLFGDKKLVFSGIILQGLLIYFIYTLMGSWMGNFIHVSDDYRYTVSALNMPESISNIISESSLPFDITYISEADTKYAKEQVSEEEIHLLIVFPEDFDAQVAAFDLSLSPGDAPQVQIWANNASMESIQADTIMKNHLSEYERALVRKFDVNKLLSEDEYDLNTGVDFTVALMMSIVPMLLISLMYQGCMAIAPESIAGEKERGTLGTLLVTPAKRSHMALAKIVSITIFGVLGAIVSFLGMMLSLPRMMAAEALTISSYSVTEYLLILMVTISTVLVFMSILSIMSAYAKSIKEANSYAAPFLFVCMACGMSSLFTGGALSEYYYYLIPVFNSAQCLASIFNSNASILNFTVTLSTNIVVALVCTGVLAMMFRSEKIIFDK